MFILVSNWFYRQSATQDENATDVGAPLLVRRRPRRGKRCSSLRAAAPRRGARCSGRDALTQTFCCLSLRLQQRNVVNYLCWRGAEPIRQRGGCEYGTQNDALQQ